MTRYSCTLGSGECVFDMNGEFDSLESCRNANCQPHDNVELYYRILSFDPVSALQYSPQDRVNIIRRMTGATIPLDLSYNVLADISEENIFILYLLPQLRPFLYRKYGEWRFAILNVRGEYPPGAQRESAEFSVLRRFVDNHDFHGVELFVQSYPDQEYGVNEYLDDLIGDLLSVIYLNDNVEELKEALRLFPWFEEFFHTGVDVYGINWLRYIEANYPDSLDNLYDTLSNEPEIRKRLVDIGFIKEGEYSGKEDDE